MPSGISGGAAGPWAEGLAAATASGCHGADFGTLGVARLAGGPRGPAALEDWTRSLASATVGAVSLTLSLGSLSLDEWGLGSTLFCRGTADVDVDSCTIVGALGTLVERTAA